MALPVAAAACLFTATGAYAASGVDTVGVFYNQFIDSQTSADTLHIGDCTMDGALLVGRPNASGVSRVKFQFETSTRKTSNFDQWHNSWEFFRADGSKILETETIDGLRMSVPGHPYDGEIDFDIHITGAQWVGMNTASWHSEC